MDKIILSIVTRSNNIYSFDVYGIYFLEKKKFLRSSPFSHRGCSWYIVVLRDQIGTFLAYLERNDVDVGPAIIQVSFSLGFRWKNGPVFEEPPKLNWIFTRGSYGNLHTYLPMEGSKNKEHINKFSSNVTITCRFLEEEEVAQQLKAVTSDTFRFLRVADASEKKSKEDESTINKLREDIVRLREEKITKMKEIENLKKLNNELEARNLHEVDTSEKKLKEAESTINKLRADIADLVKEKKSNMKEIENLKKLNKELDLEVDALKKKFNEAQSTISKLRSNIDVQIEGKKSIMKRIENLEKLNKELDLNPEVDALKEKVNEAQSTIRKQGKCIDDLIEEKKFIMNEVANLKKLNKELELEEALSSDFRKLLSSGNKSDVVLKVKGSEFPVHKSVLVARSPVFLTIFSHDSEEDETGVVMISDCDPESFSQFLNFLYSGRVGELTVDTAQQLYATSDKYDVQALKSICRDHLKHNLTQENVCDVAVLAERHFDDDLMSAAQLYFNGNYLSILQTSEWMATLDNNPRVTAKLLKEMAAAATKESEKM